MIHKDESAREMLEVRAERRLLLCKIISVIGTAFLLVLGVISIKNEMMVLGSILLSCLLIGNFNLYLLYRIANIELSVHILNGILFTLSLTLLFTGGVENTGIYWVYPILAINLFINRFRSAVLLYGTFLIVSSLLLFTPLSEFLLTSYSLTVAIRFELTLIALYLICLTALYSQESAYNTIIKLHDEDIRKLAYYDSLTGLPNRWHIKTTLTRLLKRKSTDKQQVGILYIDLDNFKQVNDNYGHEVGDELLRTFSRRLKEVVRPTDIVGNDRVDDLARLAGDEFIVVLDGLNISLEAGLVAERILKVFEGGLEVGGATHSVFASIGIAIYPQDATSPEKLLHNADIAMYKAKENGRNRFEFYTREIAEKLQQRHQIEDALKSALVQDQLKLVFMPIYDCQTLELISVEVLLRCDTPAMCGVGPEQFIPVAERTNLIKDIDLWVINNSLASLVELQSTIGYRGKFCINISGVELQDDNFPSKVAALIRRHAVAPSCIEFEITETAIVQNDEQGIAILKQLRELGVSLALDDFGTGYTAFSQLIHYPADCLKIDRSFVGDLSSETDARNRMVKIIMNLAKLYELTVIAEGIETKEQLEYLQTIGCDRVQGFLLAQPLSWQNLVKLLVKNNRGCYINID